MWPVLSTGLHAPSFVDGPCRFKDVPVRQSPSGDTSSGQCLQSVKLWLKECLEGHSQCKRQIEAPLPRRVIDINSRPLRLVETNNETGRYICLSHCWGKKTPRMQTTTRTIEEYRKELCWERLPRTFKDAIIFAKKLGAQYIWIDRFCIVQDDPADWEMESSKMAAIYANAFLTIAASRAHNSTEGCFSCSRVAYRKIDIEISGGIYAPLFVRQGLAHPYWPGDLVMTHSQYLFHQPDKFPLLSRGWVYQERLLSRRVIHFGPHELAWECSTSAACECRGWYEGEGYVVYGQRQHSASTKLRHALSLRMGRDYIAKRWREIVGEYSGLSLTYLKDRLPALSGTAKEVQQVNGDRYLAGLWMRSLPQDLLWYSGNPLTDLSHRLLAPSWSWASVSGRVVYEDADVATTKSAKAIRAECITAGCDPTGQVASGKMTTHCRLLTAKIHIHSDQRNLNRISADGKDLIFRADYLMMLDKDMDFVEPKGNSAWLESSLDVYLLHLATKGSSTCIFLVLKAVNRTAQTYERIGIAENIFYRGALSAFVPAGGVEEHEISIV